MPRIITFLLYTFFCLIDIVFGQDTIRLEMHQRIEQSIKVDEKHIYLIDLGEKQFVCGKINQEDTKVNISLYNPNGMQIPEFEWFANQDKFYWETTESGLYGLEVIPLIFTDHTVDSGKYTIEIMQVERIGHNPKERMDQLLNALYFDGPGGALAIIRDREITYSHAYGLAEMPHQIPFTLETASNIGSVSKQFTGFAIALLESEGKLSLEDDIRKHIADCPDFGQPITIQNLLDHTSGYREIKNSLAMKGIRGYWTRHELIQQIQKQKELQNMPGSRFSYSNTGYILLAEIIESVSGLSFPVWMDVNVFQPLGMNHTTVNIGGQKVISNSAYGYKKDGNEYNTVLDEPDFYGASSIYSTVIDLSKWLRNFSDARVGGREVISKMTKPSLLINEDTLDYAFGLEINRNSGFLCLGHDGFDGYHYTKMAYYPEIDVGIIILNNFPIFHAITNKLNNLFINELEEGKKKVVPSKNQINQVYTIDPAYLQTYAGQYQAKEDATIIITFIPKDNYFDTNVKAGKFLPSSFILIPVSDSTFISDYLNISVTFSLDSVRKVKHAILQYDGKYTLYRVPLFEPNLDNLLVYTGLYYSSELEVVYKFAIQNDLLTVKFPNIGFVMKLEPTYNHTFSSMFLGDFLFESNEDGKIIGVNYENVYFEKLK